MDLLQQFYWAQHIQHRGMLTKWVCSVLITVTFCQGPEQHIGYVPVVHTDSVKIGKNSVEASMYSLVFKVFVIQDQKLYRQTNMH